MSPFGPEQITTRHHRLPDRQMRRGGGGATGLGTAGGMLFGGVFVVVGTCITLAGLKIIPIDARNLHVPFPVFAIVGLVFLLPGLWVWLTTFKGWKAERRRQQHFGLEAQEPAILDYPWDRRRWTSDRWGGAKRMGFGALFMSLFMSVGGYLVFFEKYVPLPAKAIFCIFILATVWVWFLFMRELWRGCKYGATAMAYDMFPLRLGQSARLSWTPPDRLLVVASGSATLRCVREWTEVTGSGKNRTTRICHESLWESAREVDAGTLIRRGDDIELNFTLPADQPETSLSDQENTIFWEVELKLAVPGLDFHETYLVPVYEA